MNDISRFLDTVIDRFSHYPDASVDIYSLFSEKHQSKYPYI
jgi:hypothetical protein